MSQTVAVNRKLLASSLVAAAELIIQTNGPSRYAETLLGMFEGVELASSAGAMRDWLIQTPKWRQRYEAAVELYQKRRAGLDPNHPELVRARRALADQAGVVASLRKQIREEDAKQTVFEQLEGVLREVVVPLEPTDYILAKVDKKAHPVDMVLQLTDEHADEVIQGAATWGLERYDFNVFCLRLEMWQQLAIEYATGVHLPQHRVERLHIFKTGDTLHGNIHGDKHRNHFGNDMRAAVAVADAEAEAIAGILERVPYVNLVGVSGNHPRTTVKKDYADPHDNFDYMVMALIQARLSRYIAEGRLDVHAPRSWSAFVDVRGKLFALNHGDDAKGTWGIPWYGFSKKEARVQALVARKSAKVDFFMYGHYHTDMAVTDTGARAIHGAAFTLTDAFAINAVTSGGEPMQPAMMIDDHPGMRSRILDLPIWLRHPKNEDLYWSRKLEPRLGRTGAASLGSSDAAASGGRLPVIKARK